MKKTIFVFIVLFLLILLSGCFYRQYQVDAMQDEWNEKYNDLERERNILSSRLESFHDSLSVMEDPIATLFCYFEDEPYVTRQDAEEAFSIIHEELRKYY